MSINNSSFQAISSSLCTAYCQAVGDHYKYVVVSEVACTCGTEISFDTTKPPSNDVDAPKRPTHKCSMSASKTMIGNAENNVVALYNIEFDRQFHTSKLAPTTCRVFEHELFYTSYGLDRFTLQSEVGHPLLRADCKYKQSNLCLQALLHSETDITTFTALPDDTLYGNKDKTASKTNLNNKNQLAYLDTCKGEAPLSQGNEFLPH